MLVSLIAYTVGLILLFLLRRVLGLFTTTTAFFVGTMVWLKVGFDPIIPASVIAIYGATTLIGVLLYVTSSDEGRDAFWGPIRRIMILPEKTPLLIAMLIVVPGVVAWQTYLAALPSDAPPPKVRSVHPSPPSTIPFQGVGDAESITVDLIAGTNPLRALKESDPEAWAEHMKSGKAIYYQNCYYCHGDRMAADGHIASAVNPPPISFQDPGTIAMLQESFLFWRVSKGGPGLPDAGTPWDSSMPVWEDFLSEQEIWEVIAYLYEYTGYQPRANVDVEGH